MRRLVENLTDVDFGQAGTSAIHWRVQGLLNAVPSATLGRVDSVESYSAPLQEGLLKGIRPSGDRIDFAQAKVLDVGTRDGRFIQVFYNLRAREVWGIDPSVTDLNNAISSGRLKQDKALAMKIEDIPEELKGYFDCAAVFNFSVPITSRSQFFGALKDCIAPNGFLVMTFAELEILGDCIDHLDANFKWSASRLIGSGMHFPHGFLVIAEPLKSA